MSWVTPEALSPLLDHGDDFGRVGIGIGQKIVDRACEDRRVVGRQGDRGTVDRTGLGAIADGHQRRRQQLRHPGIARHRVTGRTKRFDGRHMQALDHQRVAERRIGLAVVRIEGQVLAQPMLGLAPLSRGRRRHPLLEEGALGDIEKRIAELGQVGRNILFQVLGRRRGRGQLRIKRRIMEVAGHAVEDGQQVGVLHVARRHFKGRTREQQGCREIVAGERRKGEQEIRIAALFIHVQMSFARLLDGFPVLPLNKLTNAPKEFLSRRRSLSTHSFVSECYAEVSVGVWGVAPGAGAAGWLSLAVSASAGTV